MGVVDGNPLLAIYSAHSLYLQFIIMKPTIYYNDFEAYCCRVIEKNIERGNLPDGAVHHADIKTVDLIRLRQYKHIHLFAGIGGFAYGFSMAQIPTSIRILTAGFPCQPFSLAGLQLGTNDDRYLWPITCDAIRTTMPDYAILENVASLLSAERGKVFGRILYDLAEIGYDAEWQVLSAATFGAPHKRERIWIIANAKRKRRPILVRSNFQTFTGTGGSQFWCKSTALDDAGSLLQRLEQRMGQPAVFGNDDGIPARVDRLKGLGNSIVPQIAAYIGECIKVHAAQ